ncbi:hypothetical protein VCHENC02_3120A, partial [Vibrio harveyi]
MFSWFCSNGVACIGWGRCE